MVLLSSTRSPVCGACRVEMALAVLTSKPMLSNTSQATGDTDKHSRTLEKMVFGQSDNLELEFKFASQLVTCLPNGKRTRTRFSFKMSSWKFAIVYLDKHSPAGFLARKLPVRTQLYISAVCIAGQSTPQQHGVTA